VAPPNAAPERLSCSTTESWTYTGSTTHGDDRRALGTSVVRTTDVPSARVGRRAVADQAEVQAVPLRLKADGLAVLPVWVAWKPMLTDAPAAMTALYGMFLAVTWPEAGA